METRYCKVRLRITMIKTNLINFLIAACIILSACKSDHEYIKNTSTNLIEVEEYDPSKTFLFDQFFDISEIKTTILEFDKPEQALIGNNYPRKIKYSDGLVFIMEDKDVPIKIFDRLGRFISAVGNLGKSPNEISSIYDFTIDAVNDRFYLFDIIRQEIKCYDYNGVNLSADNIYIPNEQDLSVRNIEWTGGGFLLYNEPGGINDFKPVYYLSVPEKKLVPIDFVAPYIPGKLNHIVQFHTGSDNIWITKNFCDTLYIWNEGVIKPKYVIPQLKLFYPQPSEINASFTFDYTYVQNIHQVLNSEKYLIVKCYQKGGFLNLYYRKDGLSGQLVNTLDGSISFEKGFILHSDLFYLNDTLAMDYVFDLKIRGNLDFFSSLKKNLPAKQFDIMESTYTSLMEAEKNGNGVFVELLLDAEK